MVYKALQARSLRTTVEKGYGRGERGLSLFMGARRKEGEILIAEICRIRTRAVIPLTNPSCPVVGQV